MKKSVVLLMSLFLVCTAASLSSAQSTATKKSNTSNTSDRLPLERGWYLPEGSNLSCDDLMNGPSAEREGVMLSYDGKSLNSSAHEYCKITHVANNGNVYMITTKCEADEKMGNGESVDNTKMIIKSRKLFTIDDNGKVQTYSWKCALPKDRGM
jgi:hypothetical protein